MFLSGTKRFSFRIAWPGKAAIAILVASLSAWNTPSEAVISITAVPPAVSDPSWVSTLLFRTGIGVCTATIVGPRAILTAAHCLGQDKSALITLNHTEYSLVCKIHPDFAKNQSADFALCDLDRDLAVTPERVNVYPATVSRGAKVYIAGFGCRIPGGVDGQIGELTVGQATLVQMPTLTDEVIFAVTVGSAVCSGDGGGGTYFYPADKPSNRILIGVNARGDANVQSFVAATSTNTFLGWARAWSADRNSKICGLMGDDGCQPNTAGANPETVSQEELRNRVHDKATSLSLPSATALNSQEALEKILTARVMRVVTRPGISATVLVTRVCGEAQSDTYFEQFDRYNKASGTGIDRNTLFGNAREIVIPLCAAKSRILSVQTAKNDKVWTFYRKLSSGNAGGTWTEFERPSDMPNLGLSSPYFLDVFAELNPGINIKNLPPNITVFVPKSPITNSPTTSAPAIGASPQSVTPEFGLPSTYNSCAAGAARNDYPYDLDALLRVLQANRRHDSQHRSPIPILIADSGLDGTGSDGVFTSDLLAFRGNFKEAADLMTPEIPGTERNHGAEVASVALGGPIFARVQAAMEPRIKLLVRRIYRRFGAGPDSWTGPDSDWFGSVVDAAKTFSAQIVNLSLKTQAPIPSIQSEFQDNRILYVVAAGNLDGDISSKEIYPAKYGASGSGHNNLITVAAIYVNETGAPSLAPFSNWGSDYIDIGAAGCLIPALSYDAGTHLWAQVRVSGTSFSAPLVSFAAAMIKSELPSSVMSATETKRRILASADVDYNWSSEIADGRTLNLVKALSLYQDVVEIDPRRLLFGSAVFKVDGDEIQKLELTCNGKDTPQHYSPSIRDLYKVHPDYRNVGGRSLAKVYFKGADGELFKNEECELQPNLRVEIKDDFGSTSGSLPISDIRDIVMKSQ